MYNKYIMKRISFIFILLGLLVSTQISYAGRVPSSCVYKGKPLYGKVKIVDSFEDFRVKKVSSFEDLKVKQVTSFPDKCGRWKYVDSFEDFKIKFVDSFEDFSIKYVDSFEGL